jgi:hypothetical protein
MANEQLKHFLQALRKSRDAVFNARKEQNENFDNGTQFPVK